MRKDVSRLQGVFSRALKVLAERILKIGIILYGMK